MERVKRQRRSDVWIIKNNGAIVYPYSEAERKGIGRREFRNAIDQLIAKGFLDIAHQGTGGRSGDMTKYFIDSRWCDYGTPSFRQANKCRVKDSRNGRGWSVYHAKKKTSSVTKLIPEKVVSHNRIDTPSERSRILSSSTSVTPKEGEINVTGKNDLNKRQRKQLLLWSNDFDTIL